jgi:division protein CdvB (Snf7/Vps24/ESCRT-III family)
MPTGNPTHLLKLADREFKALTEDRPPPQPSSKKFKPMKMKVARFDQSWDRKRGAAARLTAVLLQEDDAALQHRVCESDRTVKTYAAAADWLARESAYLRKMARLLDTAGGRLSAVLGRCQAGPAVSP